MSQQPKSAIVSSSLVFSHSAAVSRADVLYTSSKLYNISTICAAPTQPGRRLDGSPVLRDLA